MPAKIVVKRADSLPTRCPYCGQDAYYVYIYLRKGSKLIPRMVNYPAILCKKCGFIIK